MRGRKKTKKHLRKDLLGEFREGMQRKKKKKNDAIMMISKSMEILGSYPTVRATQILARTILGYCGRYVALGNGAIPPLIKRRSQVPSLCIQSSK